MTEEQVLFAAFFHDLGKLLERARELEISPDLAAVATYAHAGYSAQFIRAVRESGSFDGYDLRGSYLARQCSPEVEQVVLRHHQPETLEGRLIQLADWIQSAERKEKEKPPAGSYLAENLLSPVCWVDETAEKRFFSLEAMTAESLLPRFQEEVRRGPEAYRALYRDFLEKLRGVQDFEQLLSLSEIYLSAVPAQTGVYEGDISLFDHARLVAGLTQILYRDVHHGVLLEGDLEILRRCLRERDNTHSLMEKPLFYLWKADLSGIQKFIFTVPSDQAVRMIKGRSVYLDLLLRYVVKYLLRELGLSSACLLYLGGGNAEVLLPFGREQDLQRIRERVVRTLLYFHQGELYLAVEWLPVSLAGLFRFMETREVLQRRIEHRKKQKFRELGEASFFEHFFVPQKVAVGEGEGCERCGRKKSTERLCLACGSFVDFTDMLKRSRYLLEETVTPLERPPQTVWEVFECLGFRISFSPEAFSPGWVYRLEEASLATEREGRLADGFIPGSFRLPEVTFEEIAQSSRRGDYGDLALAYLKMDVDNLGTLFMKLAEKGKERASALSLYRAFSRRLELFFGVYLVNLIRTRMEAGCLYPVFVGGDDLFLIGGWREMVVLAGEIRQKFTQFGGSSRRLTLSAGLSFFPPKFPAIRASQMVEEALEMAKGFAYPDDILEAFWVCKDKVSVFNEILSWGEFEKALELYWELEKRVRAEENAVSRAVFRKIEQSLAGFTAILNDSLQGVLRFPRIWRFLYFLRDHRDIAERIEAILVGNVLQRERIRNPRLVLVANRLAAMATRVQKER